MITPTRPPLPFTSPWLLAPMEGVTDPVFRDTLFEHHPPSALGGAFTEFIRIVDRPLPSRVIVRSVGPGKRSRPVGVQFMAKDPDALAETAARAADLGAPIIDLNFGCPARGAERGCVGSALLKTPESIEALVRAVSRAVGDRVPVSAKIRAGYDDDSRVEELARAVGEGGASLLTVHCRTRREGYCTEVSWERIARAVQAVSIPVCGNGGITTHSDLERMRSETGCSYAMVGRGALADPWIFSGRTVPRTEAARFLVNYADAISRRAPPTIIAKCLKQLIRYWVAGGFVRDENDRRSWLRESDPNRFLDRLRSEAAIGQRLASSRSQRREKRR